MLLLGSAAGAQANAFDALLSADLIGTEQLPFTGARIETTRASSSRGSSAVAPSRGRELKRTEHLCARIMLASPLHGGVAAVGIFATICERVRAADEELAGL